jgi:hypothetical protein
MAVFSAPRPRSRRESVRLMSKSCPRLDIAEAAFREGKTMDELRLAKQELDALADVLEEEGPRTPEASPPDLQHISARAVQRARAEVGKDV